MLTGTGKTGQQIRPTDVAGKRTKYHLWARHNVKQNILFCMISTAATCYLILGSCYEKNQSDKRLE